MAKAIKNYHIVADEKLYFIKLHLAEDIILSSKDILKLKGVLTVVPIYYIHKSPCFNISINRCYNIEDVVCDIINLIEFSKDMRND